jgi:hypothetical protein
MPKKVQINFDDGAFAVIERLKEASGGDIGCVIRDALSLFEWARQKVDDGMVIGAIKNGTAVAEVILPFKCCHRESPPCRRIDRNSDGERF